VHVPWGAHDGHAVARVDIGREAVQRFENAVDVKLLHLLQQRLRWQQLCVAREYALGGGVVDVGPWVAVLGDVLLYACAFQGRALAAEGVVAASDRVTLFHRKKRPDAYTLIPLSSFGLWLAVTMTPALAHRVRTVKGTSGVWQKAEKRWTRTPRLRRAADMTAAMLLLLMPVAALLRWSNPTTTDRSLAACPLLDASSSSMAHMPCAMRRAVT
jgi:hypothetical protein